MILAAIPKSALALAAGVLGALLIAQTLVAQRSATALAELRAAVATATASASERERVRERQWSEKHQEVSRAYQIVAQQMLADRAAADAAAVSLHDAARARAARRCPGPGATPASGSPSADTPDFLLSELFALADRRAGDLALEADARRAAGLACERAYDALR